MYFFSSPDALSISIVPVRLLNEVYRNVEVNMQYILLIYDNEGAVKSRSQEEMGQLMLAYQKFTQDIVSAGNFKAGDPLQPTNTATTVRLREGKTLVTDGPFAETKEQLGGYYLIEAKDLDQAIAIAARVPSAQSGSIEVRPIRKM
jgi:hypothetical protein